jgi:hypothetical protein
MADIQELPQNTFQDFLRRRRLMNAVNPAQEVPEQPSMTEQYMKAIGEYPKYSEYQPSRFRRALGFVAGFSGQKGAQRSVEDAPYYKSTIPYQQRIGALKTGAEMEMTGAKSASEIFRNRMIGQRNIAQAETEPSRAYRFAGQGAREFAQSREYRPETEEAALRMKRASIPPRTMTFPGQGKGYVIGPEGMPVGQPIDVGADTRQVEAARIRAKATLDAANIRANKDGAAKHVNPSAQINAQKIATQHVINKYPEAEEYFAAGAGGLTEITPPQEHWYNSLEPKEQAKFDEIKAEYDRAYEAAVNATYGEENEDEEDFEGGLVED